jgi:hypothetical protein
MNRKILSFVIVITVGISHLPAEGRRTNKPGPVSERSPRRTPITAAATSMPDERMLVATVAKTNGTRSKPSGMRQPVQS